MGDVNIQDFLQDHYFAAFAHLAERIGQSSAALLDSVVVGYDTLNEPSAGWIGVQNLLEFPEEQQLKNGNTPTPFQCMLLGQGLPCTVETWAVGGLGPVRTGTAALDPKGTTAWRDGKCLWAALGVWDPRSRTCLAKGYFARHPGTERPVDFLREFWKPFVLRFTAALRAVHPQAILFIEPPVNALPPPFDQPEDPKTRICFTPHWYDGITLLNKEFNPWFTVDIIGILRGRYWTPAMALRFGEAGIKDCFRNQLRAIKQEGLEALGPVPCLFGEIGIPFDMRGKAAYLDGNYDSQIRAMDANIHALEKNLLSYTLWNYCPENSHSLGDQWNGEDLSIWSRNIAPSSAVAGAAAGGTTSSISDRAGAAGNPLFLDSAKSITEKRFSTSAHLAEVQYAPAPQLLLAPPTNKFMRAFSLESRLNRMPSTFDFNVGGRAVHAFCRPFPIRFPGHPVSLSFDLRRRAFHFHFHPHPHLVHADPETEGTLEVEIYLPTLHFPTAKHFDVEVSHGVVEFRALEQRLWWRIAPEHRVTAAAATTSTRLTPSSSPGSGSSSATEYWITVKHNTPFARKRLCPAACRVM